MKFLIKASYIISEEGIVTFFWKVIKIIALNLFRIRRVIIYELDLATSVKEILPQVEVSFRLAEITDIESMDEENYNYNRKAKKYSAERFMQGDECILAVYNGRIVGYIWIMEGYMELSQYNYIKIPRNWAYVYSVFVIKEFRGKRIIHAMNGCIIQKLGRKNVKIIITTVAKDNKPAAKAKERIGFKRVSEIIIFKLLGFQYAYISKRNLNCLMRE